MNKRKDYKPVDAAVDFSRVNRDGSPHIKPEEPSRDSVRDERLEAEQSFGLDSGLSFEQFEIDLEMGEASFDAQGISGDYLEIDMDEIEGAAQGQPEKPAPKEDILDLGRGLI